MYSFCIIPHVGHALAIIHTLFAMVTIVIMFSVRYVLERKKQLSSKAKWLGYEVLVCSL